MRRVFYERIDSTNLELRRLWSGEPLAVVAAEQSAGMGRLGRMWLSPRGGLWITVGWPLRLPLASYQAVPLAVGLATVQAIEAVARLHAGIKWPNDVFVRERKLAGILCQSEPDTSLLMAGIGINANFPAASLGSGLRHDPTSLQDEVGDVDLGGLEEALLAALEATFEAFERGHWISLILPGIRKRLCWVGQRIASTDAAGATIAEGILRGIDDSGALLIETDGGVKALSVGEISRR